MIFIFVHIYQYLELELQYKHGSTIIVLIPLTCDLQVADLAEVYPYGPTFATSAGETLLLL